MTNLAASNKDEEIHINGTIVFRNFNWFARPYTGPAFCAVNEFGPFDNKKAAIEFLDKLL